MEDYHMVTKSEWQELQRWMRLTQQRGDMHAYWIDALVDALGDHTDDAEDVPHAAAHVQSDVAAKVEGAFGCSANVSAEGCAVEAPAKSGAAASSAASACVNKWEPVASDCIHGKRCRCFPAALTELPEEIETAIQDYGRNSFDSGRGAWPSAPLAARSRLAQLLLRYLNTGA